LDSLLAQILGLQEIYLTGHTDGDGKDAYNKALSKRRVDEVNIYLKEKVNAPIHNDYLGEIKPVSSNKTDEGKKLNRRVEVTLIYKNPDPVKHITLQDVYDELSAATQRFRIRTKNDTIIVLTAGTVIDIRANTFETPTDYAIVEFKEAYTFADMIGEELSTTSNGKLLETGGMVHLNYKNEEGEKIKAQKNLNILMPSVALKEEMKLFFGEHDAHQIMNWQLNDESSGSSGALYFPNGFFSAFNFNRNFSEERCKFFFCKIRRGFREIGSLFIKGNRLKNRRYAKQYNDSIQNLMDSLGVDNYYELQTILRDQKVERGEGTAADIGYYGFSTSNMGWINCDRFRNADPLIVMETPFEVNKERCVTLVFKNEKSLFPAGRIGSKSAFIKVPEDTPVYYVVIETKKDKVLLSIVDTAISTEAPETQFEEIELSSLKVRLAKLEK
jgi:hypothetical protein